MPTRSGRIAIGANGMRVGGGAAKRWDSMVIHGSAPASQARVAARYSSASNPGRPVISTCSRITLMTPNQTASQ